MARLAHDITVVKHPDRWSLEIDGEEFPFYVGEAVSTPLGECPGVTVTILADRVRVDHSLDKVDQEEGTTVTPWASDTRVRMT